METCRFRHIRRDAQGSSGMSVSIGDHPPVSSVAGADCDQLSQAGKTDIDCINPQLTETTCPISCLYVQSKKEVPADSTSDVRS
jgi:hypothetical protein